MKFHTSYIALLLPGLLSSELQLSLSDLIYHFELEDHDGLASHKEWATEAALHASSKSAHPQISACSAGIPHRVYGDSGSGR